MNTSRGVLIRRDKVSDKSINELIYEIRGYMGVTVCRAFVNATHNGIAYVYLPRAWLIHKLGGKALRNSSKLQPIIPIEWPNRDMSLLDGQGDIVRRAMEKLHGPAGTALLNLGTGSGKTYIGLAILAQLGVPALFIAPLGEIVSQVREICKQFGLTKSHIEVCSYAGAKKPAKLKGRNAIFIDEIDTIATATRAEILWNSYACKYIIGASATIDERADGADEEYLPHFKGTVITAPSSELRAKCDARIVYYQGPGQKVRTQKIGGKQVACSADTIMGTYDNSDGARYLAVTAQIEAAESAGHKCILVYSRFKAVLRELYSEYLAAKSGVFLMTGDESKKATMAAKEQGRILLCTYQFCSRGFSLPRATALIMADPYKDKLTQVLGRILRKSDPVGDAKTRFCAAIYDERTFIKRWAVNAISAMEKKSWDISYLNYP